MKSRFHPHVPATLVALVPALAPHVPELPPWINVSCLVLWIYAWTASRRGWPAPGRFPLAFMAVFGFGGAMVSYGGAIYSQTYVAMLAVMAALKTMETRAYRDVMISLFLAYFLIVSNLFFRDDLASTLYMLLSLLITTAVLVHVHGAAVPRRAKLRLAGVILLQALPIAAILFYLFPRIEGNLFGMTQSRQGRSGFTDRISPGNLSRLVENEEVAFRVRFEDAVPEPDQRYWRGLTFARFDGRTWERIQRIPIPGPEFAGEGDIVYTVNLEPHDEHWLFALEMPARSPEDALYLNDFTLVARRPVRKRMLYTVRSVRNVRTGPFPSRAMASQYLDLPRTGNPRARALAQGWAASAEGPEAVVEMAMDYLRRNDFRYTLEPPLLGVHTVDDILFETRRGYCEHYASAFAFLMRAAGVPARLVGGYLGGEINPYAEYMIVRQSHAHAWVEVHLDGTGWTRVDPTAAVAPERILEGVRQSLSEEDWSRLFSMPDLGPLTDMFRSLDLGWDAVNTYWLLWVMSYTARDQRGLLSRLGVDPDDWLWTLKAGMIAMGALTILLAGFAGAARLRRGRKADPAQRAYDRFCRKMARTGLARDPAEGPRDFAARIVAERPDLAEEVHAVLERYVRLRYGRPEGGPDLARELERRVRRFSPKPGRSAPAP